MRLILREEHRLHLDEIAHVLARGVVVDHVGVEEAQPPLEAEDQRLLLRALGLGAQPFEVPANGDQPGRCGDEVLVRLLGPGEPGVIAARPHVRGPEEVFFGLVHGEVVGVELMEEGARLLHGGDMKPQMQRGGLRTSRKG